MIRKIINILNKKIPKANTIIFNSFPDVSGNSLALYKYIRKNRKDIVKKFNLVWTVGDTTVEDATIFLKKQTGYKNHLVVPKKSLKGILTFLTSKYIFSTHGYFNGVKTAKNQTHINLWHGMPFKSIGKMLKTAHINGKNDEADVTIATSEVFKKIMAKSFDINESNVIVTGQPCNDDLISYNNYLKKIGINKDDFKKVLIWMPTYRKSVLGDIRKDGNENSFGVTDVLNNHIGELSECLERNKYLLIIKPHPMDSICLMKFHENNNIKILLNDDIAEKNVLLYELLSNCDILITDYSSVFIDFMITGKPIAFVCDDIKEYSETRGFSFDNPIDYMPGELINDSKSFINYLDSLDNINSKWKIKYDFVRHKFNKFNDSNSSKRVCNVIFGKEL